MNGTTIKSTYRIKRILICFAAVLATAEDHEMECSLEIKEPMRYILEKSSNSLTVQREVNNHQAGSVPASSKVKDVRVLERTAAMLTLAVKS